MSSPAYLQLSPASQREMAEAMVTVCHRAAALLREEVESDAQAKRDVGSKPTTALAFAGAPPSRAQSAGKEFSGVAASRVAGTTQQILNAVSFPRFVTELINGVFRAMLDSSRQQMQSYVELLNNVAASTEGFADANLGPDRAREWLAERYPGSFVVEGDDNEDRWEGEPREPSDATLRLRPGGSMPSPEALRVDLGLQPDESVPTGDPERSLVPLARRILARQRQQMLATMVMLGMQRIVIESGRIHASMRFHIDTRSAAQDDRASQFDARHTSTLSGSLGFGPWGVSASMTNTIGYVSTQKTQTTEEMNTDLDLSSSVELVFKTDYLPLERMAGKAQVDRIKVNTLNPAEEAKSAAEARATREKRYAEGERGRRESIDKSITTPPAPPAAPAAGDPGSVEAAEKARKEADERKKATAGTDSSSAPSTDPGSVPGSVAAHGLSSADNADSSSRSVDSLGEHRLGKPVCSRSPDVVFIPSPERVVEEMLALAGVRKTDLVYDLGCGDGRIVVAAAKKHGCLAFGFDLDPQRVEESRRNVTRSSVGHLVRIEQRDLFTVDLSGADVVFVYLLPELNVRLIPQFERMKPGARIVSHDFDLAGIVPDRVVQVYLEQHRIYKTFYLWTTPLKRARTPVRHEWSNSRGITTSVV